jgi:hypothetical protein
MTAENVLAIGAIATAIAAIGGLILGGIKLGRWIWRLARRTSHLLDDWGGEEARDGKPAEPGIMQRLASMEHELKPNSGGSIKDAVTRIEGQVIDTGDKLQAITDTIADVIGRVDHLEAGHSCRTCTRRRRRDL